MFCYCNISCDRIGTLFGTHLGIILATDFPTWTILIYRSNIKWNGNILQNVAAFIRFSFCIKKENVRICIDTYRRFKFLPSAVNSAPSNWSRVTSSECFRGADFSVIKNCIWSESSTSFFRSLTGGDGELALVFVFSRLSKLSWRDSFSPKYFVSRLFIHFTNGPKGPYFEDFLKPEIMEKDMLRW